MPFLNNPFSTSHIIRRMRFPCWLRGSWEKIIDRSRSNLLTFRLWRPWPAHSPTSLSERSILTQWKGRTLKIQGMPANHKNQKTEHFHKSYCQGGQSQVQAKLGQQRMKIALPIPNPSPISYAESFSLSLVRQLSFVPSSGKSEI